MQCLPRPITLRASRYRTFSRRWAFCPEEGSAAWRQGRPWPGSMAAYEAALAAERERLRAAIDLMPAAELVVIGEARRRQAEDVQRRREAESAIARAKPSPGYSPGM